MVAHTEFPRPVPGKIAMRWRVLGAFVLNIALWAVILHACTAT